MSDEQKEIKPTKKFGSMQQQREAVEEFGTIGNKGKSDTSADTLTQKRQEVKTPMPLAEEMKRQTVYMPQQLATRLKVHAATIGDDISGIIRRLVADYLDEVDSKSKP